MRSVTEGIHKFTASQKYKLLFSGIDTVHSGTRCASIIFHWGGAFLGLNTICLILEAMLQISYPQHYYNTTPCTAAFEYDSLLAHLIRVTISNPLDILVSSKKSYVFVFQFSKFQSTSHYFDYRV
jgi:hypothetical protein